MGKTKLIGYAIGAGVATSLIVLLVGIGLFGFQWAFWHEWEGRVVGIVGTVAGVAAAVLGLLMASRAERRHQLKEVPR